MKIYRHDDALIKNTWAILFIIPLHIEWLLFENSPQVVFLHVSRLSIGNIQVPIKSASTTSCIFYTIYCFSLAANVAYRIIATMKHTLKNAEISWLTSTDAKPLVMNNASQGHGRTPFPIPPEIGSGWVEFLPLALGMDLFRGNYHFKPEMAGKLFPIFMRKGN